MKTFAYGLILPTKWNESPSGHSINQLGCLSRWIRSHGQRPLSCICSRFNSLDTKDMLIFPTEQTLSRRVNPQQYQPSLHPSPSKLSTPAIFKNQEHGELRLVSSLGSQRFPCILSSTIYYTLSRLYYNDTHLKCSQYSIMFIDMSGILDNYTHTFNIHMSKININ